MTPIPSQEPFRFFAYIARRYTAMCIVIVAAVIIAEFLNDYLVVIVKNLTNSVVNHTNVHDIWMYALLYPAVSLASQVFWRISGYIGMRFFHNTRERTYNLLYNHAITQDRTYFVNRFAGSLLNKVGNVVEGTQQTMQRVLWNFFPTTMSIVVLLVFVYRENVILGVIITAWTSLYIYANYYAIRRWLAHSAYDMAASRSTLAGKTVDSFSNIASVHEYANWSHESSYIQRAVLDTKLKGLRNWTYSEHLRAFNNLFTCLIDILLVAGAVTLFVRGSISAGVVIMIITVEQSIRSQLSEFGNELRNTISDYTNAQEGLAEIMQPHTIVEAADMPRLKVARGAIELDDLTFAYGDRQVLKGLNIHIQPGQRVGLVGRSGAGKSTLAALLLRNFEPVSGAIRIDGQDITTVTLESLRTAIGFVPQDTGLFHRTLYENIAYARSGATRAQVMQAARRAQAHQFIKAAEQGYDTLVGERGVKLSGGQRQRIAIARAFLKNAPILILDEATSSLDSESETAIQKSLHTLMKGKTVIAIAHRLSTLREMDRIIVMEHGVIVEDGSPAQLTSKDSGVFKSLWEHQAGGFIHEDEE